jgi:ATP-dependent Clp protease ATP-binding subunit ClpB
MNSEKFTNAFTELLQESYTLATQEQYSTFSPIQLLSSALTNDFCASGFRACGVEVDDFGHLVQRELQRLPKVTGGQISVDSSFQKFLGECEKEAKSLGDEFISLDVCMLAFSKTSTLANCNSTVF